MVKKRRELVKELGQLCDERCSNSKYDKFFVEEFVKKFKKLEDLEEVVVKFRLISD